MEPQAFGHSWIKLCCWHALQLACHFFAFFAFFFLRLQSAFASPLCDVKVAKLPCHVAIVVDSEDASRYACKIVQLLRWLAQLGIQHVSLYDMEGALKSAITVLADAFGRDSSVQFYSHELVYPLGCGDELPIRSIKYAQMMESKQHYSYQPDEDMYCFKRRGVLTVEVLSLHDSKDTIVQAARHICLKALQSDALSNLNEEDINTSLRETGGAGPDPDLLLLFSNARCLLGFPAWRLRLTEIQHLGSIGSMTEKCVSMALNEFTHKHQRYGK